LVLVYFVDQQFSNSTSNWFGSRFNLMLACQYQHWWLFFCGEFDHCLDAQQQRHYRRSHYGKIGLPTHYHLVAENSALPSVFITPEPALIWSVWTT